MEHVIIIHWCNGDILRQSVMFLVNYVVTGTCINVFIAKYFTATVLINYSLFLECIVL